MRVGRTGLRMSSGEVRHFTSEAHRDAFERVAEAIKHGFVPTKRERGERAQKDYPSRRP